MVHPLAVNYISSSLVAALYVNLVYNRMRLHQHHQLCTSIWPRRPGGTSLAYLTGVPSPPDPNHF